MAHYIEGRESINQKHNTLEYKVSSWKVLVPPKPEDIISYLGSGVVKGLGPAGARKIVDVFGLKTIDVIRFEFDRLKEVPGLSQKIVEAISRDFPK